MRFGRVAMMMVVMAAAAGCGKPAAKPVELTAEQLQAMEQRNKEVATEEGRRERQTPVTRNVDRAEQEERGRR
jgi:hypothetical protein